MLQNSMNVCWCWCGKYGLFISNLVWSVIQGKWRMYRNLHCRLCLLKKNSIFCSFIKFGNFARSIFYWLCVTDLFCCIYQMKFCLLNFIFGNFSCFFSFASCLFIGHSMLFDRFFTSKSIPNERLVQKNL